MGFVAKAVKSVFKAVKKVIGVVAKVVGGIFGFSVGGKSKKAAQTAPNLNKSLEPEAYRKIILGRIAAPLDVRFWQVWGTSGSKFDEVIALASHQIHSVGDLWLEENRAILNGVIQSKYVGVLTRDYKLGVAGQTALSVGGGTQWTSVATFDGCPHMVLSWTPTETKLPNGIPNRYTQICEGALVYDPRRDSTQPGGSGTHRVSDRSTWAYATLDGNGVPIGRNNALQALWYLLGWTIPTKDAAGVVTGEALVCGRGVVAEDINMSTFIAGANACEIAGYYTDLALSTEDDHTDNEDKITCDGLIGRLIDPGGLWSYYANVDDTANIAVELTDDDIIQGGSVTWNEYKGMSEQFNQVSGKYINPSDITLYQPFPYPLLRDATYETALGVKRRKTQDFMQVLDGVLAQRLARLFLNQGQYQGEFSADFGPRCLRAQAWSVVRYTSDRFGWTKLFRVWRYDLGANGSVGMLLKEIHASIWGAGSVVPVGPTAAGQRYNDDQEIAATGVTVTLEPLIGANGDKADAFTVSWSAPPSTVRRTEIRFRLVGTIKWQRIPSVPNDITSVTTEALFSGAIYEVAVRHVSITQVPGPWVVPTTAPANASGQFTLGATGTVNYAAIQAAGGTATWGGVQGKPTEVTDGRILAGLDGLGNVNRPIPLIIRTNSDILSRTGGGIYAGELDANRTENTNELLDGANLGGTATWSGVSSRPIEITDGRIASALDNAGNYIRPAFLDATLLLNGPIEANSDNSATSVPSQIAAVDQNYAFNSNGTAKTDQLPRTFVVRRYRGSIDVSQDNLTEWSIIVSGCTATINNTDGSGVKGNVTVTAIDASGFVEVSSVKDGVTFKSKIYQTKNTDAPAAGTVTGATSFDAPLTGIVPTTETSYITPIVLVQNSIKSNASGNIVFSGTASYYAAPGKNVKLYAKIQRSPAGTNTWTDAGLAFVGSSASGDSIVDPDILGVDGQISFAGTATGMSANTNYDVRLVGYKTGSVNQNCEPSGTLYGRQS